MGKKPLKRSDVELGFECGVDLPRGPGRTTHCSQCDKQIWDVSKLTRAEYEALPKTECVMMSYGDDGMIEFATEPTVTSRLRSVAAAGLMGLFLAGCEPTASEPSPPAPAVEREAEQPIAVEQPQATIPSTISRAMLLEVHRELYGEYPKPDPEGAAEPGPPTRSDRSADFPGGNHRDILQQKRNIRQGPRRPYRNISITIIKRDQ